MLVPIDGGLPIDLLKSFIDEAYALIWNKLDARARLCLELAASPYDEFENMNRLIDAFDLGKRRQAIHRIARKAILLRTMRSDSDGDSAGGDEDRRRTRSFPQVGWPKYQGHEPLAFLAQIDLDKIAKLGSPIRGLPSDGLLSVFSAWGWVAEEEMDPQTPRGGEDEQIGWTAILLTPSGWQLKRRETPPGLHCFPAAAVEPTAILSLPNHRIELSFAGMEWNEDEYDRFDEMQSDYRAIQMSHWLKNMTRSPATTCWADTRFSSKSIQQNC